MRVQVRIVTEVFDNTGHLITAVCTVQSATIGDNPALIRDAIVNSDIYGKAESLNLDQVEAGFRR